MKCPLCGKPMSTINESAPRLDSDAAKEAIFFCEQHGPMNKISDLKEKADQISKRA